jgi:hypothetical protein
MKKGYHVREHQRINNKGLLFKAGLKSENRDELVRVALEKIGNAYRDAHILTKGKQRRVYIYADGHRTIPLPIGDEYNRERGRFPLGWPPCKVIVGRVSDGSYGVPAVSVAKEDAKEIWKQWFLNEDSKPLSKYMRNKYLRTWNET